MAAPSTSAPTTDDILGSHRFTAPGASSPYAQAPTASSVLGSTPLDPTALHPLAGLVDNKDLDYLLLDDDKLSSVAGGKTVLPSRGWGDELCYGTGSTYLAGLALGGAWGFSEGMTRPISGRSGPSPAAAVGGATAPPAAGGVGAQAANLAKEAVAGASEATGAGAAQQAAANRVSFRLRWNNILNQVTRRGTSMGNSAGVLALIYNGINSTIDVYRGNKHDVYGSMTAAALSGLIWRSTAGVKPMIITSGILTAGAAGWSWLKLQFL